MNDFDSILKRLRDAMPKNISTIEGSFSGDILGAVANELAKFYAIDIETIYDKAFISTAKGEWLDRACADWNIFRQTDENSSESDDTLRQRAIAKIKSPSSSGNADDYRAWAMATGCIKSVYVDTTLRTGNTVNIYILPLSGQSSTAILAVKAYIENKMPIGAKITVLNYSARSTTFHATFKLEPTTDIVAVTAQAKVVLARIFEELTLSGKKVYLNITTLAAALAGISGVADVTNVQVGNQTGSYYFNPGEYPVLATVTIDRVM